MSKMSRPISFFPRGVTLSEITNAIDNSVSKAVSEAIGDELLTAAQACRLIKVSRATLNKYTQDGSIRAQVIGKAVRYRRSELLNSGRIKYQRI